RRRRPQPLLVLLVAWRKVKEARVLDVRRRRESEEGPMLAARVGLLGDVDLAGAGEGSFVPGLHGGGGGAVAPGGEAVALLRGVDDLTAGHRSRRPAENDDGHERPDREATHHCWDSG